MNPKKRVRVTFEIPGDALDWWHEYSGGKPSSAAARAITELRELRGFAPRRSNPAAPRELTPREIAFREDVWKRWNARDVTGTRAADRGLNDRQLVELVHGWLVDLGIAKREPRAAEQVRAQLVLEQLRGRDNVGRL